MPVELSDEQDDPLELDELRRLADALLHSERLPEHATVTLNFVSDGAMTALNEAHMRKQGPTDVLSFPIEELSPGIVPHSDPEGPPLLLGDVVVCPAQVRRQAASADVPFRDEMALMVVHGMLHLLGYDHEADEEAEVMEQRERDLLALVGRARP
jgi:probable rRNA maturation factor